MLLQLVITGIKTITASIINTTSVAQTASTTTTASTAAAGPATTTTTASTAAAGPATTTTTFSIIVSGGVTTFTKGSTIATPLTTTAIAPAVSTLMVSTANAEQDTITLTSAGAEIISSLAAVESVSTTNAPAASGATTYSAHINSTPESYINTPPIQVNQEGGDLPGMVRETLKILNSILIIIYCTILIVLLSYRYSYD